MTSTDRLVTGVIAALFAPDARLYETKAAFGVVIDCVAFATTTEVMMATPVAMRMTPGRENFWIRIVIAFILFFAVSFRFNIGTNFSIRGQNGCCDDRECRHGADSYCGRWFWSGRSAPVPTSAART